MQLRVPITLTPGRPRRAPPWALEAYSTPSPRPIPRAPPRAPSGPAALLAPPPLPATARSRALGPVTGRSSGPWSGILGLFFYFLHRPGPGFPYSPYSGWKSRARVRVLLDRADHCGQVDVQHAAARGRTRPQGRSDVRGAAAAAPRILLECLGLAAAVIGAAATIGARLMHSARAQPATSSLRRPCEHWRAAPHLLGDRVGPPCRHAARERLGPRGHAFLSRALLFLPE